MCELFKIKVNPDANLNKPLVLLLGQNNLNTKSKLNCVSNCASFNNI